MIYQRSVEVVVEIVVGFSASSRKVCFSPTPALFAKETGSNAPKEVKIMLCWLLKDDSTSEYSDGSGGFGSRSVSAEHQVSEFS